MAEHLTTEMLRSLLSTIGSPSDARRIGRSCARNAGDDPDPDGTIPPTNTPVTKSTRTLKFARDRNSPERAPPRDIPVDTKRNLLCLYTSKQKTFDDFLLLPHFQRKMAVSDDQICSWFAGIFGSNMFKWDAETSMYVPFDEDGVQKVHELLERPLESKKQKLVSDAMKISDATCRFNKSISIQKQYLRTERTPLDKAVANVYKYFRTTLNKTLGESADIGGTYAEITEASATRVIAMLSRYIGKNDIICEGGCGFGTFALHAAQVLECRVWGVECMPQRCMFAAISLQNAIEDEFGIGKLVNTKVALVQGNLFDFESFGPATLVYLYDEAMEPELILSNLYAALRTKHLRYIVSTKAARYPSYDVLYASLGFERLESLSVTQVTSNKASTLILYKSTWHSHDPRDRCLHPPRINGTPEEIWQKRFLDGCWDSNEVNHTQQEMLEKLKNIVVNPIDPFVTFAKTTHGVFGKMVDYSFREVDTDGQWTEIYRLGVPKDESGRYIEGSEHLFICLENSDTTVPASQLMMESQGPKKLELFEKFCGVYDHPLYYETPGGNWVFWSPDVDLSPAAETMFSLAQSKLRLNIQRFNPVYAIKREPLSGTVQVETEY